MGQPLMVHQWGGEKAYGVNLARKVKYEKDQAEIQREIQQQKQTYEQFFAVKVND